MGVQAVGLLFSSFFLELVKTQITYKIKLNLEHGLSENGIRF